jgi:hypothetical protein
MRMVITMKITTTAMMTMITIMIMAEMELPDGSRTGHY